MSQHCPVCHITVAPYDPEKVTVRKTVYHRNCLKKAKKQNKQCYNKFNMKNGTTQKRAPELPEKDNVNGTGKNENIENRQKSGKSKRGGRREGSGRKQKEKRLDDLSLTQMMDLHISEEVEVTITDRNTGTTSIIKKPRILLAIEKLFERGTKKEGETQALDKWLDRALGRPAQAVALKHSGEIGTFTAKRPSKAALAAKRAYEQELYRGGE